MRRSRNDAIEGGIVKLVGRNIGPGFVAYKRHHVANRRDEHVGVHDLDGIDTADIAIDQISPRERQLAISRGVVGSAGIGQDMALIIDGTSPTIGAKKTAHGTQGCSCPGLWGSDI